MVALNQHVADMVEIRLLRLLFSDKLAEIKFVSELCHHAVCYVSVAKVAWSRKRHRWTDVDVYGNMARTSRD